LRYGGGVKRRPGGAQHRHQHTAAVNHSGHDRRAYNFDAVLHRSADGGMRGLGGDGLLGGS